MGCLDIVLEPLAQQSISLPEEEPCPIGLRVLEPEAEECLDDKVVVAEWRWGYWLRCVDCSRKRRRTMIIQ